MLVRIVLTALLAGAIAGAFAFGAHSLKTTPLIIAAEVYETGAGHDHGSGAEATPEQAQESMGADAERLAYNLLADLLMAVGFAFLLTGAIALSGREVDWRRGLIWGLCGFAAFHVAPGLGLAPELPGMQAADLADRQLWWLGTAALTASGLALIFFAESAVPKAVGIALLFVPHLIGAPHVMLEKSDVPAELAAEFAIASLVISGLFWLVLGGLTGLFYERFGRIRGEIGD